MSNVDKNTPVGNDSGIPQKKSVVGSFVENFLGTMGLLTTVNAADIALRESRPKITKKEILITLGVDTIGATLFGIYDSYKTAEHNRRIDELTKLKAGSHTQHYEQEKLASPETSPGQSR